MVEDIEKRIKALRIELAKVSDPKGDWLEWEEDRLKRRLKEERAYRLAKDGSWLDRLWFNVRYSDMGGP